MVRRADGGMVVWSDGRTIGCAECRMVRRSDGRTVGRTDGRTVGQNSYLDDKNPVGISKVIYIYGSVSAYLFLGGHAPDPSQFSRNFLE